MKSHEAQDAKILKKDGVHQEGTRDFAEKEFNEKTSSKMTSSKKGDPKKIPLRRKAKMKRMKPAKASRPSLNETGGQKKESVR